MSWVPPPSLSSASVPIINHHHLLSLVFKCNYKILFIGPMYSVKTELLTFITTGFHACNSSRHRGLRSGDTELVTLSAFPSPHFPIHSGYTNKWILFC